MECCPRCQGRGRKIQPETLEAQVAPARLAQTSVRTGWQLCLSEACDVVYFRGEETVSLQESVTMPFHKSSDPQRLVCFCFQHSVASVEADVRHHGTSTIQASIKAACKANRDDCLRKNPQGRCCLGNVGLVLKASSPEDASGESPSCCGASSD